MTTTKGQWQQ
jgi:hypothetical protein